MPAPEITERAPTSQSVEKRSGQTPSRRHPGLERARVISMCAVIVIHIASAPNAKWGSVGIPTWTMTTAMIAATRFAVPVFVMVSGALVLTERTAAMSFRDFYLRRASRLLIPTVVWVTVYFFYRLWRSGPVYGGFKPAVGAIIDGTVYYHLYYLWIILGLYVLAPFLARGIRDLSPRGLLWLACGFVFLGFMTSFVAGQFQTAAASGLLYCAAYIGYFLLGRVLLDRPVGRGAMLGWLAGFLLAVVACTWISVIWTKHSGYPQGTALFDYLSPTTILLSVSAFMLLVNGGGRLLERGLWNSRAARFVSDRSLGIYLIHPIFLTEFLIRGSAPPLTAGGELWWIVETWVKAFVLSVVATALLSRIPLVRRAV